MKDLNLNPIARDRPLARLARGRVDLEIWKPLLLWHMTRDEFLLRDFLAGWLFPAHEAGVYRIRPEDLRRGARALAPAPVQKARLRGRREPGRVAPSVRVGGGVCREAGRMSDFEKRLKDDLGALLELRDPRASISTYHDMP
jgi:hypothetical protein